MKPETIEKLSNEKITTRSSNLEIDSFNESNRSVEAVFSTENAVNVFDWELYRVVPEILLTSGMRFEKKIPLLDSHNRFSVKDQLGSGRNMTISDNKLVGRLYFSKKKDGEDALNLVREGHITDVSIGYTTKSLWIEDGDTYEHAGRSFEGPLKLGIETDIREISLTSIGADDMAKIRMSFDGIHNKENIFLKEENLKLKSELDNVKSALKIITYNHK